MHESTIFQIMQILPKYNFFRQIVENKQMGIC